MTACSTPSRSQAAAKASVRIWVCSRSARPPTRARCRWPSAARYSTASVTAAASSDQSWRNAVKLSGAGDRDRRELELAQHVQPAVVDADVGDQHAVHPTLAPPAPVHRDLGVMVGHHLQGQRVRPGRQLTLDAADQLHEERLHAQRAGRSGQCQPDRSGARPGQRPGGQVGVPADLLGDGEDAFAGRLGDARLAVERVGDRALGHAGLAGDVRDGGPLHQNNSLVRQGLRGSVCPIAPARAFRRRGPPARLSHWVG